MAVSPASPVAFAPKGYPEMLKPLADKGYAEARLIRDLVIRLSLDTG